MNLSKREKEGGLWAQRGGRPLVPFPVAHEYGRKSPKKELSCIGLASGAQKPFRLEVSIWRDVATGAW